MVWGMILGAASSALGQRKQKKAAQAASDESWRTTQQSDYKAADTNGGMSEMSGGMNGDPRHQGVTPDTGPADTTEAPAKEEGGGFDWVSVAKMGAKMVAANQQKKKQREGGGQSRFGGHNLGGY